MPTLHRFHALPTLPPALAPLLDLAKNLWWTWTPTARSLFASIDPDLFREVAENPLTLLGRAPKSRLEELANQPQMVAEVRAVVDQLGDYLGRKTWFDATYRDKASPLANANIAYFSMEFGIHEHLPVYSGGLGVLAGDHLKSASDLGLPLVGVGIAFSKGYFRQSLDIEGWQTERYPPNEWRDLPVSPALTPEGERAIVKVALPIAFDGGVLKVRDVQLQGWVVQVGRVRLFLLDADLDENVENDRALTNTLYGGDRSHRIRQEILLGVGGMRLLRAVGINPTVCHMNEGHSAFLAIERIRSLMVEDGVSFAVAREAAAAGNVFTTHTPVPAGNDVFPRDLVYPYLETLSREMGVPSAELLAIGRERPTEAGSDFSMPVLAIRTADGYNGVSELHGHEAREMWKGLWPEVPVNDVPIGYVTNGVHAATWVAPEMAKLYSGAMGEGFLEDVERTSSWARVDSVPDEELWRTHEMLRASLIEQLRVRLRNASRRRGVKENGTLNHLLDPNVLTIGFARRFATYKRGTLLFRDPARLHHILSNVKAPVQLVFAGKAHPQDMGGKELIRDIVRASRTNGFRGRVVFIEDYDMGLARDLVRGVDVWLNTPRRPLEASGTSGMKAAMNGILHASVLDGWWCEAYAGDNGFAIGDGEQYEDSAFGDHVEAQALYRLLEEEIVPLFYDRDESGLPRKWVSRMKRSIASVGAFFHTHRMVSEYAEKLYEKAAERSLALRAERCKPAESQAAFRERVLSAWPLVKVEDVVWPDSERIAVGQELRVEATVSLPNLTPADVSVDIYYGKVHGEHAFHGGMVSPMTPSVELPLGRVRFSGAIRTSESGEHAFAVRVLPKHQSLSGPHALGLIAWH